MSNASDIIGIGSRGEGITRDGRFIPFAVPGDRVDAEGRIIAGSAHVNPPCRHFPQCGGCQLQHASDDAYAHFIGERITRALHSHKLSAPLDTSHVSPPNSRRRATLRARRAGKTIEIGFHASASHTLIDLAECHILHPALWEVIAPLRNLLSGLLGDREQVSVALTLSDQGIDLLIEGIRRTDSQARGRLATFAADHALARMMIDVGEGPEIVAMASSVSVTLGRHAVALPPKAFLQATADGEAALIEAVVGGVAHSNAIVDLFAGLGTFALNVPAVCHAAEGSRDAAAALASTRAVTVDHRDLFRRPLSAAELKRFDAAIIDPPRAGAIEQVRQMAASTLRRIAYVSCNPATFARDAAILCQAGFTIERIKPVGQFRWSTHVELAALFTRRR